VDISIPETGAVQREVTLRCDQSMLRSASMLSVVIEGGPEASDAGHDTARLHGIAQEGLAVEREDELQADVPLGGPVTLPGNLRFASSVVATCGVAWVSDPMPLPSEGHLRIRLRPTGPVVVLFETPVPDAAGEVVIRTSDGRPFSVGGDLVEAPSVALGDVIEWLPEGKHVFKVTVGGMQWPDAVAIVRAGQVATLLIRP